MYTIGIDEVGRGPIAGPVVVCACAIKDGIDIVQYFPKGILRDSKKLSEKQRTAILEAIKPHVISGEIFFGIGEVSATRIDELGIVPSIKEAMLKALSALHNEGVSKESFVYLDGSLHAPDIYKQETVIKGDEKISQISLASIFAKGYRDDLMVELSKVYPGYGFESHVGYGTAKHYDVIKEKGLTGVHRKSFLKSLMLKK
ncbi:MAG: ribonuclease ribonuclease [Candidatus Parcubacteria bacterium]|jgi:ribonuclease HII